MIAWGTFQAAKSRVNVSQITNTRCKGTAGRVSNEVVTGRGKAGPAIWAATCCVTGSIRVPQSRTTTDIDATAVVVGRVTGDGAAVQRCVIRVLNAAAIASSVSADGAVVRVQDEVASDAATLPRRVAVYRAAVQDQGAITNDAPPTCAVLSLTGCCSRPKYLGHCRCLPPNKMERWGHSGCRCSRQQCCCSR